MCCTVLRFKNWTKYPNATNCPRYRSETNCQQQQTTAQRMQPLNLLLRIKPLSNSTQPFSSMRTASMHVTHRWTSNSTTMCLIKVEERNGGECTWCMYVCIRCFVFFNAKTFRFTFFVCPGMFILRYRSHPNWFVPMRMSLVRNTQHAHSTSEQLTIWPRKCISTFRTCLVNMPTSYRTVYKSWSSLVVQGLEQFNPF